MESKKPRPKNCPLCKDEIKKGERYYTDKMGFPMCELCFKFIHPTAYERLKNQEIKKDK